jgi:hypothetical protein
MLEKTVSRTPTKSKSSHSHAGRVGFAEMTGVLDTALDSNINMALRDMVQGVVQTKEGRAVEEE